MENKFCIVFDFDGTIADSMPLLISLFNRLAADYGFQKVDQKEVDKFRNRTTKDMLKKLAIPTYKLAKIVKKVRNEFNRDIDKLRPVKGIEVVLKDLHKKNSQMGILTSNSEVNVKAFLLKNKIDFFDFIYAGSSIFGKSRVLKKMLKAEKLSAEKVIYVGDETRDIDAAKKCNVKVISVGWGFNSAQILQRHNPDWFVSKPKELSQIFK